MCIHAHSLFVYFRSQNWRKKFESGEGGIRPEEVDDLKRKLNARLQETEQQLEAALSKANSLEKAKNRLSGELEDLMLEVERFYTNKQ